MNAFTDVLIPARGWPARPLSRAAARLHGRTQKPVELAIGGRRQVLTVVPDCVPPFRLVINLRIGACDYVLAIDEPGFCDGLALPVLQRLPAEIVTLCVGQSLSAWLEQAEHWLRRPVSVLGAVLEHLAEVPPTALGFRLQELADGPAGDGLVRHGALWSTSPGGCDLLDQIAAACSAEAAHTHHALRARIGTATLRLDELRTVAAGCVLLVQEHAAGERGFALMTDDGAVLARFVVPSGSRWCRKLEPGAAMKLDLVSAEAAAVVPLDQVPVQLSFEIGAAVVELRELEALAAGAVVELGQPLEACPVRILCGGAFFATGELVDIAGRLGVRVLSVSRHA